MKDISMRRCKIDNLIGIGYLTLLFGCNSGSLLPPEISSEPVRLSIIATSNGVGFINQAGEVTVEAQFIDAKPFVDGLAAVQVLKEDGKKLWGFINHKGEFVIQPKYRNVESFSDKLAFVWAEKEFKPTIIDQRGNEAIKLEEEWHFSLDPKFSSGLASVYVNNKIGFINTKGEMVIEPKFDSVRDFSDGLAFVQVGEGFDTLSGYIDQSGKLAIPFEYKNGTDFAEGHAFVSKSSFNDFILIDKTGNLLKENINLSCTEGNIITQQFSEGLMPVRLTLPRQKFFSRDSCGYINPQGEAVIPPNQKFEKAQPFSEGLAAVQIQDKDGFTKKWGFVDKSGKIVIEPKFEDAASFQNGLAYVKINAAKQGYINHSGQFVWQPVTF